MGEIFKKKLFIDDFEMVNNTAFAIIAIVAALALFGMMAITLVTIPSLQQQAEAAPGCEKGLPGSAPAFNASKGRCFRP